VSYGSNLITSTIVAFVSRTASKRMSSEQNIPISSSTSSGSEAFVAPTPQNTPLNPAPITLGLSRPTVPDIPEGDQAGDSEEDEDNAGVPPALLNMVQGKLAALIGKSSGYVESLPVAVKKRVEGLKGIQVEYSKIEVEYKKEVAELEKKVRPRLA
jgi:nucleosome assembly protein 1-like 1